jgi:hypothetical protein
MESMCRTVLLGIAMRRHIARDRSLTQTRVGARTRDFSQQVPFLIGLIAILIQGLLVQTHIHDPQTRAGVQSASVAAYLVRVGHADLIETTRTTGGIPNPPDNDPALCPLCQEISLSGQFLHDNVLMFSLPHLASHRFATFAETTAFARFASHIWYGRAPPQS